MMEVDCIEWAKLVSIIDQVVQSLNVQNSVGGRLTLYDQSCAVRDIGRR